MWDIFPGLSRGGVQALACDRPHAWRDAVEVVAMDGFTMVKTATTEELTEAVTVTIRFT
ncbi:hypothetical protein [Terrabacter sp. 2RAF25]|uniref:hypothetical protein n=1 Tax=Terrabacter sp. 2RAF25 TaxID=3232998 RepID=UPI003F9E1579